MFEEIVNQIEFERYTDGEKVINIELNFKELKLLKELHGNIGLDEFFSELKDKIKEELK